MSLRRCSPSSTSSSLASSRVAARRGPARHGPRRRCGGPGGRHPPRSPRRRAAAPVCRPMRTGSGPPPAPLIIASAAAIAPGAVGKAKEERVSLRVHLDAAVGSKRLADHPAVLGERLRVRLRAELVQQFRRALDVGEQEGDGAGRKITHRRFRARKRWPRRAASVALQRIHVCTRHLRAPRSVPSPRVRAARLNSSGGPSPARARSASAAPRSDPRWARRVSPPGPSSENVRTLRRSAVTLSR